MKVQDINIEDLEPYKEKICIGGRHELEEMCTTFNSIYGNSKWNPVTDQTEIEQVISFTPKLSFKRGTYDRIKAAYIQKVLRFHIRNSDLYNLSNKVEDSKWLQREFNQQIRRIQNKVWTLRNMGLHNLDNSDEIIEKTELLLNRMIESFNQACNFIEKANKNDNGMICDEIQLFLHDGVKPDNHITDVDKPIKELLEITNLNTLKVRVYVRLSKVTINVKRNNSARDSIGKVELGPIEVCFDYPLFRNLNDHWDNIDFAKIINPNNSRQIQILRNICRSILKHGGYVSIVSKKTRPLCYICIKTKVK